MLDFLDLLRGRVFRFLSYSILILITAGCNLGSDANEPVLFDEPIVPPYSPNPNESPKRRGGQIDPDLLKDTFTVRLVSSENVRTLQDNILEVAASLPAGSELSIPKNVARVNYQYRTKSGEVKYSSNLFYRSIKIVSVPPQYQDLYPVDRIDEINNLPTGLFVTTTVGSEQGGEAIAPVIPVAPSKAFLSLYEESGRPQFSFTSYFKKRFGNKLNNGAIEKLVSMGADLDKSERIMESLYETVDRTEFKDSDSMFVSRNDADYYSIMFEDTGLVQTIGAWSIAVFGTATRHGFGHVPCAEFQSEIVRQAYAKAGYDHKTDFSKKGGNELFWTHTAAVVNLANSLNTAGWVPWEAKTYIPKTGAIAFHYKATTPGHAYAIAGEGGRFIVDNGNPRGTDLRRISEKILRQQYMTGVFFLPSGIIPDTW